MRQYENKLLTVSPKLHQIIMKHSKMQVSQTSRIIDSKRPLDSYVEFYLRLSQKPIREDYLSFHDEIRMGKILEDLDSLAGSISYLHCDDGQENSDPLTIVTASLDRIDLHSSIPIDQDLKLSGHVTCLFFYEL